MVIGVGDCQGSFLKPGDPAIATATQQFLSRATRVYAVLRAAPFPGDSSVPGKYQVVFDPGMALSVDDQGVTYFTVGCSQSSAALIASGRFGANPDYLVKP
jgi:hypothetical protein